MDNKLVPVDTSSVLPTLDGEYHYPSDLINPETKNTKEYCLKYIKSGYYHYFNNRTFVTNSVRSNWLEKRTYADGNQDNRKYAARLSKLRNAQNQTVSYNDLDQRLLKLIPKYLDIIISYLEKIDYDIYCDSIHPEAHMEREEMKWGMWTEAMLQPFFKEMEEKSGVKLTNENQTLPKSLHELDLMMQYSVRLNEEMQMELGQQMVLHENDWKETKKLMLRDSAVLGVMFASAEIDRISNRIKINYEDPVNAILEDFRGHKGTMQRRGVIRQMTIAQAMLKYGSQFTREDYFNIAKSACGKWGNPQNIGCYEDYVNSDATYNDTYLNWENNVVYVMDYEWDSCDRLKFERQNVYGNEMTFRRPFNKPLGKKTEVGEDGLMYEREVYATDIKTIYGGEWIIGTDFIANWGKKINIPRPNENPKECYGKFMFYRVGNTSMLDRMLPYIDSMQLAWLKIQNLKARALISGMIIHDDAFVNVLIDGKVKTQQELVEMGLQTGLWVVNSKTTLDDDNPNQSTKVIEKFEGGMGNELVELMNSMIQDRANLQLDTGINEFMDSSTPNPNSLVGVAEMAVAGAQNAMYPLMSGFITMHEMICTTVTLNIQLLTRYKNLTGYVPSLGMGTKFTEITSSVDKTQMGSPVMFGVRIVARATQEQKQRLLGYIDNSLASSLDPSKGGIEITDAIEISRLINNGTNLKLVIAIIADRISKYKENMHQKEVEKIQTQSDGIVEQTKTASEEAAKAEDRKLAIEKELYTHKTDEDIRKLREEWGFKTTNEVTKTEGKKELETVKKSLEPEKV